MLRDIQDFPTTRRESVLSGTRSAISPRKTRRNAGVSAADVRRAAARRSSRSPARSRSRSPTRYVPDFPMPDDMTDGELFAMLPPVEDMEAEMADDRISAEELLLIEMRRRKRGSRKRRRSRRSRRRLKKTFRVSSKKEWQTMKIGM